MRIISESSPTSSFYHLLQEAYETFNKDLFDNKLPPCLLTVQRDKKTMGFFSANRWINDDSTNAIHEIALNPSYFANHRLIEIFQTTVHEQCHLWQFEFGNPSRKTYHNKEWADKMESIGLMPSSTSEPGGKRTGQHMGDYPLAGGRFYKTCTQLLKKGFNFTWVDRYIANSENVRNHHYYDNHQFTDNDLSSPLFSTVAKLVGMEEDHESNSGSDASTSQSIEETQAIGALGNSDTIPPFTLETPVRPLSKVKYSCSNKECKNNAWGKPKLNLLCGDCTTENHLVSMTLNEN